MAFCVVRALDTDRFRYWFGIPVFTTLSLYAHFFSVWSIGMVNLYFLLTVRRHWRKLGKWVVVQGAALVLCVPALFFILELSAIYESFPPWFERPTVRSGFISFKTFFAGYSPNTVAYWGLFLLAGALFVGGLVALRKNRERLVLILLLTVLPIVGNVVVWRLRQFPFYEHRIFIFSAAVSYGVVAYGIRRLRPEVLKPIVVVVLCALMAPCLADYYAQRLHPLIAHRMGVRYKVAIREAAAYVAAHLDDGDLVGHSCNCTSFPFQYYLPGARQQTLCITKEESLAGGPFTPVLTRYGIRPIEVETAIDDAKRLWLVESWWEPFDLPPNLLLLRARLDGHLIREDRQAFDGVTVYRYRTNAGRLSNLRTTESWIPTPGRLRITGGKTVP
jgi:hypothetical protein